MEGTFTSDNDLSNSKARGAEEMGIVSIQVADDAPTRSAMSEHSTSPPGEEQTQPMEMEDRNAPPPQLSLSPGGKMSF